MTLVSGGIRFVRIFARFPGDGASKDSGVVDNSSFSVIAGYVFANFRDEARVIA